MSYMRDSTGQRLDAVEVITSTKGDGRYTKISDIPWVRKEYAKQTSTTLSTLRATPNYTNAGVFGNCMTGGVLTYTYAPNRTGDYTMEFWVKKAVPPGLSSALLVTPLGVIGQVATTGTAYWNSPSLTGGSSICDGNFHHVAAVISHLCTAGVSVANTVQGIWVDGVKVIAAQAQVLTTAWINQSVIGGLVASGTDSTVNFYDEVRVSYAANDYFTQAGTTARYQGSGSFTPPASAFTWDAQTVLLAHMESSAATTLQPGYDPRPDVNAYPPGTVLFRGSSIPTDVQVDDMQLPLTVAV